MILDGFVFPGKDTENMKIFRENEIQKDCEQSREIAAEITLLNEQLENTLSANKDLLEKHDLLQGMMNEKSCNIKTLEEKLNISELKSDDFDGQNKKLKETIAKLQGQVDNESKRVTDLLGKLGNEQKNLKQVQQSCDLALKGALKENAEIKVIKYT